MLIISVAVYFLITIGIGLWAAQRVHNSKDYLVAGRSLPLTMNMATVFATWFGAETVLSVSATFAKDGLGGIVADPFGSSFCLLFVALFFARAFYRMDLLTIGDFYHKRYSKPVEVSTSVAITASYLGWTSAQLTALGLVFSVLSGGAISLDTGIVIGAVIVLGYTIWGGMWSVALTDLFQTVVILIGLTAVAWLVGGMAGGPGKVIAAAAEAGKLEFWPRGGAKEWLWFLAAWMTLAIGSIPQQDVFQRVTSAKDEQTAVRGSLLGGLLYFCFAFIPMFIAYAALVIEPGYGALFAGEDAREIQRILPDLILERTPMWAQVLFFGALLSAILSTASGALLAPTALFTENVLRPLVPRMSDQQFLLLLRVVLVTFTLAALLFALNSKSTMYEMVQNAYKVTLVSCIVPLAAGIYWKRASVPGAMLSVVFGLFSWGVAEFTAPEATIPPQLVGLAFSILGMGLGSLVPPRK
ncbi:MAG: sodium:solute symporter [Betaproteobacteria bacterium RIFCSPLOWO2_12_FULL_68_19]|nr:MAG: sodium:solute symporter [Betaproteobacteria bacterium RIFCSPLOWO2_12_FULL_68_19]